MRKITTLIMLQDITIKPLRGVAAAGLGRIFDLG